MYDKEIKLTAYNKGYICFYDKEHPLSTTDGRVFYHRHVASIKIGRWLTTKEIVHHIDENKLNNSPDNLQILSNAEHTRLHITGSIEDKKLKHLICPVCKISFKQKDTDQITCSIPCANKRMVKNKALTKELLESLIPTTSWKDLGKMFGYSDVGIKKRAVSLGCDINKAKYKHSTLVQ